MGALLLGITQAIQLTDLLLGSKAAAVTLQALGMHFNLTPEQVESVRANGEEYKRRIQQAKDDIAAHESPAGGAPPIRPA